ncbi:NAD(P)H-flavin reductase [Fluoribacter dumoffii]|uniref:CDP-6-deoxy-L-threo-D-glycero-4-hexulose-3-dehydr ase reductase n=1 Tax=Fluoribacter dumoffii TaxID=463 RepID=A0A377G5C6_9GAMM|nr:NAD(P)H-flavin reductase [Fluoribacter dumoffii]KTC91549.1 NAD(P)H-flavin reductase [Fluoribacter dumoffii NY 23]MCW8387327.1 NAD(P)H-flavin reductase [Fluoribacter dumoffii]MCW8497531.1 NAD(P)H-flavin reductase [Fluoribacter dumoffii]STO20015.1 CDP-6-deoxy-L-threo-D-glycero-4-hexulose-3-dehydrase reductase [Fluoribacter dumoffii]
MKEKTIKALVEDISPLTDTIMRLVLTPEKYVDYQAGQYLQVLFDGEAFSYSIANAPLGSHKYELHIRHSLDNPYTQRLFAYIKQHGSVNLRLPFGTCSIEHLYPHRPILFIAGGTGFAPVKAMIEQLLSTSDTRPFELFWGARLQNDLYMDEKVRNWQTHVSRFNYFSSVSEDNGVPLVSHVLTKHPHDLGDWQIVISGPFDMVYSTRDALVAQGVTRAHLFSDAFSFEAK